MNDNFVVLDPRLVDDVWVLRVFLRAMGPVEIDGIPQNAHAFDFTVDGADIMWVKSCDVLDFVPDDARLVWVQDVCLDPIRVRQEQEAIIRQARLVDALEKWYAKFE